MSAILLDEHSSPSLRQVLGSSLARATEADFAVARIRLAQIDLTPAEVARVRRWRVLLGRLDVESLTRPFQHRNPQQDALTLLRLFDNGRMAVRAAGLQGWNPDFAVLRGLDGGGVLTLVGSIYFGTPQHTDGPSFTCILTTPSHAAAATARFDVLWQRAYDVEPVVREALERLCATHG
ncbi:MAG: hypothetical protein FWJ74_02175 [Gemmatimonadota bacterium]|jgi:hypothetical protein